MRTSDFDYFLPQELIAQTPIEPRDQSRLMVLDRSDGSLKHHHFFEITDFLHAGDVLVFNDSRVIPARLTGKKSESSGKVEILLLRQLGPYTWETLVKPGKRIRNGTRIELSDDSTPDRKGHQGVTAEAVESGEQGTWVIRFSDETLLPELGRIPLPPYIHVPLEDPKRYQTVYASVNGSAAAPTAGLHFTPELISRIKSKGIHCLFTTLHVGLDTFRPVTEDNPLEHHIYREYGELRKEVADELSQAKREGRRIICIGTTTVRLVEQAAQGSVSRGVEPFQGWVDLFILPGHEFHVVDGLVTNFHLPKSTLLMLVTAFGGKGLIDRAYREAIEQKYRFYSFGDAMMIF